MFSTFSMYSKCNMLETAATSESQTHSCACHNHNPFHAFPFHFTDWLSDYLELGVLLNNLRFPFLTLHLKCPQQETGKCSTGVYESTCSHFEQKRIYIYIYTNGSWWCLWARFQKSLFNQVWEREGEIGKKKPVSQPWQWTLKTGKKICKQFTQHTYRPG